MDTNITPKSSTQKPRFRWQPQSEQNKREKPYRPGEWVKIDATGQLAIVSSRQRDLVTDQYIYKLNIPESRIGSRFGQIHARHSALTSLPTSSTTLH